MALVFISHSNRDEDQAARLLDWLHAKGFGETFLDFDKHAGIAPGAHWEKTLYRELARAEAVILVLTANWFESKWCFAEFTQARALGKAIFPIIESPTGETFVSPDIQHLDFIRDRAGGLERLGTELTEIALNARGGFPWEETRPPFPGLMAFDAADAAVYFGRDDDVRHLIERLNSLRAQGSAKILALLGASGSGKSSLVRAGLVPRLRRDRSNWIVLSPFRPQLDPLRQLAVTIASALGPGADWRDWREALAGANVSASLGEFAADLRTAYRANGAHILIVIDQAEELFGTSDKTEAAQFFQALNAALGEGLPFTALMALRSDYLGHLQQAPGLEAALEGFSLKPMPLERVREIIEGPAKVAGLTVDEALIAAAREDAVTGDALPLLAFALRELYERFPGSGRLAVEAYRALGDAQAGLSPLENAVRRKADEVLEKARPSADELRALKEAFVPAMVRVNADGEYVRRPAPLESLPEKSRALIDRLDKARLLVVRQEGGATMVEVAHEALLRKWPLLRGWLDEEREFLIGKDQLEQDRLEWETAREEQRAETLLSGIKLSRARAWLASRPHQLSEGERKFILASMMHRDAETARRGRVKQWALGSTIVAAIAMAALAGGFAWVWQDAAAKNRLLEAEHQRAEMEHQRAERALEAYKRELALQGATEAQIREKIEGDSAMAVLRP